MQNTAGIHDSLSGMRVPLTDLTLLPGNPRKGDVDSVVRSYSVFGQRKPIVARRTGVRDGRPVGIVIAGNHQLQAAERLGWSEIATVWTDDDEMTAKAFALADNRTSELGSADDELLAAMLSEVATDSELLKAASYSESDLLELLNGGGRKDGLNDLDEVPDVPAEPRSQLGDLWLLGEHRLLCGDATKRHDVERLLGDDRPELMVTDPPYGVAVGGGSIYGASGGSASKKNVISGDLTQAIIPISFAMALEVLDSDARIYMFGGSGNLSMYAGLFDVYLRQQAHVIVWVKESFVLRPNGYHSQYEMVYYGWRGKGGAADYWYGDRKMSDVWAISRDSVASRVHPTQKPVAICSIPIRNSLRVAGLVYDPFAGSGSTLIAAHGLGRQARCVELDPRYVDVICRRFQEHTGEKPVLERTGEPVDFTEVL